MAGSQPTQVYGVRETLAELATIDPKLKREAQKSMRTAAMPMAAAVTAAISGTAPLSGMSRGSKGWAKASRKATPRTGGRANARGSFPLVKIQVSSPAVSMADLAEGGDLGANLTGRAGTASRWVWPTVEQSMPSVQVGVLNAIRSVQAQVNKNLVSKPRAR